MPYDFNDLAGGLRLGLAARSKSPSVPPPLPLLGDDSADAGDSSVPPPIPKFDPYDVGVAGPRGSAGASIPPPIPRAAGPAAPQEIDVPPDEPGWLETIGDVIDRPDNAIRGALTGNWRALKGLIPFGETLGLYDHRKDHVSGQDVNEQYFGIPKSDDLLSGPGAAGLGTEMALSVFNFLPGAGGIKALTKAGRAGKTLGGHLDKVERIAAKALSEERAVAAAKAAEDGFELTQHFKPAKDLVDPTYGQVLRAGERVPDSEIAANIAKQKGAIGEAASTVLENPKINAGGTPALRVLENAGDRVRAGQEAFLQVGGEYDPFALFRIGGKYNPINHLPEVPGLTAPLHLPQKTLIEGPEAAQAVQDAWRAVSDNKFVNPIKKLFSAAAAAGKDGKQLKGLQDEARGEIHAGQDAALRQGEQLSQAMAENTKGVKPADEYGLSGEHMGPAEAPKPTRNAIYEQLSKLDDEFLARAANGEDEGAQIAKEIQRERAAVKAAQAAKEEPRLPLEGNARSVKGPTEIPPVPEEKLPLEQAAELHPATEEVPMKAPVAIPDELHGATENVARVPMMVTKDMRQQLYELGYKRADVDHMKPEEAWDVLKSGKTRERTFNPYEIRGSQNAKSETQIEKRLTGETPAPPKGVAKSAPPLEPPKELPGVAAGEEPLKKPWMPPGFEEMPRAAGAAVPLPKAAPQEPFNPYSVGKKKAARRNPVLAEDPAAVSGTKPGQGTIPRGEEIVKTPPRQPQLDDFMSIEPGRAVHFRPIRSLEYAEAKGIGRARDMKVSSKSVYGGRIIEIKDGIATIDGGSETWRVPLDHLEVNLKVRDREYDAAMAAYREKQLRFGRSAEEVRAVRERAADVRDMLEDERPGSLTQQVKTEKRELRRKMMAEHGIEGIGADSEAQILPKVLEKTLNAAEGPEWVRPLKSVELVSAESGQIGVGDKVKIAGDEFTLKEIDPKTGKAKLKDGIPIEVPFDRIPKDKGTEIQQAAGVREGEEAALKKPFNPYEVKQPESGVRQEKDLLGRAVHNESDVAALGKKTEQSELFSTELSAEEARGRKLAQQHQEAGGGELFGPPEKLAKAKAASQLPTAAEHFGTGELSEGGVRFKEAMLRAVPNLKEDEAAAIAAITDARAASWAKTTGKDTEDWYRTRMHEDAVRKSVDVRSFNQSTGNALKTKTAAVSFLEDGRALIHAFEYPDAASMVHEVGHILRRDLSGEELEAAAKWAGQKDAHAGWSIAAEEKFTNAFTDYLHTGAAPVPQLQSTFTKLKSMLSAIWERIKGFVKGTPAESRATFDKLLGSEAIEERAIPKRSGRKLLENAGDAERLAELKAAYGEQLEQHSQLTPKSSEWFESQRRLNELGKEMRAVQGRTEFAETAAAASKVQRNLTQYIAETAGGSEKAVKQGAEIAAGLSDDMGKRIFDVIESHKTDAPAVVEAAHVVKNETETMLRAEQAAGLATPELDSGHIGYAPHIITPAGARYHGKLLKTPATQLELLTRLEAARALKGIEPSAEAMEHFSVQRFDRAGKTAPRGQSFPVPAWLQGEMRDFFARQTPEVQKFIASNKFKREFEAFTKEVSAAHESQIPRLAAFQHLSVSEINDVYKSMGAGGEVFNTNPAAALSVRKLRHVRAMAGANFLDRAGMKLGKELEARPIGGAGEGITQAATKEGEKVFGVDVQNEIRTRQGKAPIWYDSPETAAAVRQMHAGIDDPQQATGLLAAFDRVTSVYKTWLTRVWTPFQVRNSVSNKLQSFLGGVDLNAPDYTIASQVLGGKDVRLSTPIGELDSALIRKISEEDAITRGGYFDDEVKARLKLGKEKSWNPFNPHNEFAKGAERVAAGVASFPGNLAAGVPGASLRADSSMLENRDRLAHYLFKLRQGESRTAAAASVNKYLFDYSREALSPFEQKYASRAIFFYPYTRHVIPMLAEAAMDSLGKVAAMSRLGIQPGKPDREPSFTKTALSIPHGSDAQGNRELIYDLGTPLEGAVEPLSHNPLDLLNPLLKAPLELATGKDFFLDKNIADTRKAPHWAASLPDSLKSLAGVAEIPTKTGSRTEWNPYLGWALRESPLSRASNTASRLADPRKGAGDVALNMLAGPRSISVDEEEEENFARKKAIREKLEELKHQGRAREFSIWGAERGADGRKDAEALGLMKALKR